MVRVKKRRTSLQAVAAGMPGYLVTSTAWAEPGVSGAHLPVAWSLGIGVAGLLSWLLVRVLVLLGRLRSAKSRWVAGIVTLVVLLLTVTPFVAVIAAIAITGRTM